jgi:hypothetical protein
MNAAFFSQQPRRALATSNEVTTNKSQLSRRIHRWTATVFTLSVAANFAAMLWGPPPAWITYAPLPPLLFLMITGLKLLISSWIGQFRSKRASKKGTVL